MIGAMGKNSRGNIYPLIMHEIERYIIKLVLEETRFNFVNAARILGIGRSTLYRRVTALKIDIPNK
jgi:two-component system nitrogen regulation response regulator GlnG